MSIDLLRYVLWGEYTEFIALIISIIIESSFVWICANLLDLNGKLLIICATTGTLITHPVIWDLFVRLSPYLNFEMRSLILELLVVLVEGCIYKLVTSYSLQMSMSLSFSANLASYTCGLLLYQFLSQYQ